MCLATMPSRWKHDPEDTELMDLLPRPETSVVPDANLEGHPLGFVVWV